MVPRFSCCLDIGAPRAAAAAAAAAAAPEGASVPEAAAEKLPCLCLQQRHLVLQHLGGAGQGLIGARVEMLPQVRHELVADTVAAVSEAGGQGGKMRLGHRPISVIREESEL